MNAQLIVRRGKSDEDRKELEELKRSGFVRGEKDPLFMTQSTAPHARVYPCAAT